VQALPWVVNENQQVPAAFFAAIVSHVFLKLADHLGLAKILADLLAQDGDPFPRQPEVCPGAGGVARGAALGANLVEVQGQKRSQQILEVKYVVNAEGRAVTVAAAQLPHGPWEAAEQAFENRLVLG
jgi:hypothetical protein